MSIKNIDIKSLGMPLYTDSLKSLDALYGPWDSLRDMIDTIYNRESTDDYFDKKIKAIPVGATVGIIEDGTVVEYWKPVDGQGFVKKIN